MIETPDQWPSPGVLLCDCGFAALDIPSFNAHEPEPAPEPDTSLLDFVQSAIASFEAGR